jgi:hypothetical protein
MSAFEQYLGDNPSWLTSPTALLLAESLRRTFPCGAQ